MKPPANGKTAIKAAVGKELTGKRYPLGNPPADFDADEKRAWSEIAAELPWVDKSHRMWVARAAKIKSRIYEMDSFFAARKKECRKNKVEILHARMADGSEKPHPMLAELRATEEILCRFLSALGANPAVQTKLLSNLTKSQKPPGSDIPGSPADSGRFFK